MTWRRGMLALPLVWLLPAALIAQVGPVLRLPVLPVGDPSHPVPQVSLFGVLATPGSKTVDKDLAPVEAPLRKFLPDHGFKHLASRSRPLMPGQTIGCEFGDGWSASLQMVTPMDVEGKVQMKFTVRHEGEPPFERIVRTPPNQLFFCDVELPDGNRLVLGMGAR